MMVSIRKGPQERRCGTKGRDKEKSAAQEENHNTAHLSYHLRRSRISVPLCSRGVDCTLRDLLNRDVPFEGITMLLSGDFRQTLPVVQHGSRAQIVPANLIQSNLWPNMSVHYLHQNICLDQDPESDE